MSPLIRNLRQFVDQLLITGRIESTAVSGHQLQCPKALLRELRLRPETNILKSNQATIKLHLNRCRKFDNTLVLACRPSLQTSLRSSAPHVAINERRHGSAVVHAGNRREQCQPPFCTRVQNFTGFRRQYLSTRHQQSL